MTVCSIKSRSPCSIEFTSLPLSLTDITTLLVRIKNKNVISMIDKIDQDDDRFFQASY